jgi:hypothetical protein
MKTMRKLGGCLVVAMGLVAGAFSSTGCDGGPAENSAPPIGGTGKSSKDAALERMQGGGKMTDPSKKTKLATSATTAEPKTDAK